MTVKSSDLWVLLVYIHITHPVAYNSQLCQLPASPFAEATRRNKKHPNLISLYPHKGDRRIAIANNSKCSGSGDSLPH